MGWKRVLVVVAVSVGLLSYWLYTPLPDGFSTSSVVRVQWLLASMKLLDASSHFGAHLGVWSFISCQRLMTESFVQQFDPTAPDIEETDMTFDGVRVRMYKPVGLSDKVLSPAIVYYHGGGYSIGNLDTASSTVRQLCRDTKFIVVSVDYRRAPEARFPAGFEDCVKATKYFMTNAAQFSVDGKRIAVAGDSAGGNFAAGVSLKLRDDKFLPSIKLQVLIYPSVQGLSYQLPSMLANADGPLLNRRAKGVFASLYLYGNMDMGSALLADEHTSPRFKKKEAKKYLDLSILPKKYLKGYQPPSTDTGNETMWNELKKVLLNPYYAPLVAHEHSNLPTAYMLTGDPDPLRDDGFLYADRLRKAGVHVEHANYEHAFHGIISFVHLIPEASEMLRHASEFIVHTL